MSRLTEKKIIDIFQSTLNDKFVSEDVEYFKIGKKYFVLKIDTLVESTDIPKNTNLKYFKTEFVDAKPTDENKKKMVDKSTEMLCLKEECFDEVQKGSDFKIFKNLEGKYLGIIFDDDGIEPFKRVVKKLNEQFVVYVFSLDESAREEEFEDMADMVELRPIPAVILNVYKRIFKRRI